MALVPGFFPQAPGSMRAPDVRKAKARFSDSGFRSRWRARRWEPILYRPFGRQLTIGLCLPSSSALSFGSCSAAAKRSNVKACSRYSVSKSLPEHGGEAC